MLRYRALVLALLLALLPSSLRAQQPVSFAISAFGGVYFPAADLFDETGPGGAISYGHQAGFAGGGRLAVWPTSRIGIEAEAAYLSAKIEGDLLLVTDTGLVTLTADEDATAFVGSVSLVYALIRPPLEPLAVYLSGGVGWVSRGGDFFEDFEDTSDIAGVVGLGIKYGVARGVWLRADLKDYISKYEEEVFSDAIGDDTSRLQNDMVITGGFEVRFGGG